MAENEHVVTVREIERLTPDVRRYVIDKPEGYSFEPGQAAEIALDDDDWRDEARPFTFTSLPEDDHLELTIKSYPDHDGVTKRIGELEVGDRLVLGDSWGAITDKGAGTFIAGGAGVTPFISILRRRARDGELAGCHLIFSNLTEADIILREEFEQMGDLRTTWLVTEQSDSDFAADMLDKDALERLIGGTDQKFYVCGPQKMVDDLSAALEELGADTEGITFEE